MGDFFDVFFSYNSADHAAVLAVARRLHERGIRIFLDRWYLTPGQPWPQALERALGSCGAVAVFVGASGLGPWQQRERDMALMRQGREDDFPVIPVLLSNSDPALGFLRLNTWLDLSAGTDDEIGIERLAAAVRREPPGPMAMQQTAAARAEVCPYRGLRPFREEDAPFFFGRGAFTETLSATLARQPFVAVIGASGSGKSSLVRAGLVPRLRRGEGGAVWEVISLVPTDRPLASLAAALLPLLEPDLSEVDRLAEVSKLARHLSNGSVELWDVTARVLAKQPGTDRILIFIDQWEELYTLCQDQEVRHAFTKQLREVVATGQVRVVLTMRGDFFGRALADRALSDQLQDAVVNIAPMTRDELAETIVKPVAAANLAFEPGLDKTILADVGEEPGSLPLMEFLLEGLWKERRGALLVYEAYHRVGGVSGAIARRAEEVFENKLNQAERLAAQRLLVRMVRPGDGVEDTRQRATLPGEDPTAEATVRKLADARLVVTERDATNGRETVEVAHEALIHGWQRLRDWIDHDREFLRTRERIAVLARQWEAEGRQADRLLPRGRPLAEGEELFASRRSDLEPLMVAYLEASLSAARSEAVEAQARSRRRVRRARLIAAAMALLALIAIGGGAVSWRQRERALQNAEAAQRSAQAAQRSKSRALVSLAMTESDRDPATAIRLALAALPMKLDYPDASYARVAEGALLQILPRLYELQRLVGQSVAFSPDGRTLAIGSSNGTVRLWDVALHKEVTTLPDHEGPITAVAFSPDGRTLATGSSGGPGGPGRETVRLWDLSSRKEVARLPFHPWVNSMAFSPDGRILAIGFLGGEVMLWDVASRRKVATLPHANRVETVAFSPDGRTLATGSSDKTAQLWDVATRRQVAILLGHQERVVSVAFSPDGLTLATGSSDKTARLWNVTSRREVAILPGHQESVSSVAFSPDGHTLATGSEDGTARLWEVASRRELARLLDHGSVNSVAFSPDGRTLATGGDTVGLWVVGPRSGSVIPNDVQGFGLLAGHQRSVVSVAFSPDSRTLATGSEDGTARLWDVASRSEVANLLHQRWVKSVAFSPDGRTLATGSEDGAARLWDVASRSEVAILRHQGWVDSVAFSPDGRILATGAVNAARLWDVASRNEVATLPHPAGVRAVAFSPGGRILATGSSDNTGRLWDVASRKEVATLRGHQGTVAAVAFSPDGRILATGSWDNTVRLWDVAGRKEVATLTGHEGTVAAVAFSPDGGTLATGSSNGTVRLWDVAGREEFATLRPNGLDGQKGANMRLQATSVVFSPDGRTLATSCRDASISKGPACRDDTVRLWPVSQRLIDVACARVHFLPLREVERKRAGIEEWCTPKISTALRARLEFEWPRPAITLGKESH